MRPIKFRAKRTDNDEWIWGDLIHDRNCGVRIAMRQEYDTGTTFVGYAPRVDIETVCQFTGLTDKNGVEIFEGDLIKTSFTYQWNDDMFEKFENEICEVYYGISGFMVRVPNRLVVEDLRLAFNIEVIGNVFDNSELLDGEE